jgi:hypothetical protein
LLGALPRITEEALGPIKANEIREEGERGVPG